MGMNTPSLLPLAAPTSPKHTLLALTLGQLCSVPADLLELSPIPSLASVAASWEPTREQLDAEMCRRSCTQRQTFNSLRQSVPATSRNTTPASISAWATVPEHEDVLSDARSVTLGHKSRTATLSQGAPSVSRSFARRTPSRAAQTPMQRARSCGSSASPAGLQAAHIVPTRPGQLGTARNAVLRPPRTTFRALLAQSLEASSIPSADRPTSGKLRRMFIEELIRAGPPQQHFAQRPLPSQAADAVLDAGMLQHLHSDADVSRAEVRKETTAPMHMLVQAAVLLFADGCLSITAQVSRLRSTFASLRLQCAALQISSHACRRSKQTSAASCRLQPMTCSTAATSRSCT